jgi:serine/threonine-protein kinase
MTTGAKATPNAWLGRLVGDVRIERLLGRGGMAEVYLGRHLRLDRPVAIKILHAHVRQDPYLLKLLEAEAAALTSVRHPNIVQCLDCNVVEGRPYIVMEMLAGITLQDRLEYLNREGLLPPLHVVERLVRSAAAALDHAHGRGVVHRDLKPANIMLLGAGGPLDPSLPLPADVEAMLTDFGLARLASATVASDSGVLVGTPAYISPEQAAGGTGDSRSDVYALGVILYQMLAGRVPFGAGSEPLAEVLYQHVHQPPPEVPNVSGALRQVLERALAKDPSLRYPRAGELAGDFAKALSKRERRVPRQARRTIESVSNWGPASIPSSR